MRHSSVLPVVLSGKRTSVDTGSSRRSCLLGRGRQRCAAGACWPAQTLEERRKYKRERLTSVFRRYEQTAALG